MIYTVTFLQRLFDLLFDLRRLECILCAVALHIRRLDLRLLFLRLVRVLDAVSFETRLLGSVLHDVGLRWTLSAVPLEAHPL